MNCTTPRLAALLVLAALGTPAAAQDKTVKIGVLNDMSGLYSDMTGAGSVVAAKMAVEDSGLPAKGWKIEILSGDHQNKPDVGANIAKRWIDLDKVDAITDTPTSSVTISVSALAREKNVVLINSAGASADITGRLCNPNTLSYTYDTVMLTSAPGKGLTRAGGDSWFFLTADYAFGHALERDTGAAVTASGGKLLGSVKHPLNTSDFASFLLQAQASKAKVIALTNAGGDTVNSVKQATEFGIASGGQKVVAPFLFINAVHEMGLKAAQGVYVTESFYWDLNDRTREWSRRFQKASLASPNGKMPGMTVAGVYAGVLHYLKTLEALGGNPHDGARVVAKMKETPTDDPLFGNGPLRSDGRRLIPAYLFQVKAPGESKYPWDYYKLVATIPAEDAARPLASSECPLAKSLPAVAASARPQSSPQPTQVAVAPPPPAPVAAPPPPAPVAAPAPAAPVAALPPAPARPAAAPAGNFASSQEFGRRVALVIGNGAYKDAPPLANPTRDATAIASALQRLGFQAVTLETNLGREKMVDALRRFARQAESADWALVYFAGHGMEVGGVNYLLPSDASIESDRDMPFAAVPLDQVLNATERARKLRLVILDACRNNPYANKMARTAEVSSRSTVSRGFARVEPNAGTLVVYAAKEGQTASDGDGANSPFTTALLKNLQEPGVEVRRVFDNVRDDVQDFTRQRQLPYTYGSVTGRENFYFAR